MRTRPTESADNVEVAIVQQPRCICLACNVAGPTATIYDLDRFFVVDLPRMVYEYHGNTMEYLHESITDLLHLG